MRRPVPKLCSGYDGFQTSRSGRHPVLALAAAAPGSGAASAQGLDPTGVPYVLDNQDQQHPGVMVDLITEVGRMPDSSPTSRCSSPRDPFADVDKIDFISAAMFATAARKEVIDFSDAVYTYGEGLAVRRPTKGLRRAED